MDLAQNPRLVGHWPLCCQEQLKALASDAVLQLLFLCVASMYDSFLFSPLFQDESGSSGGISSTSASVNRYILQLAQEYCGDCKNSFDELSKIIQV